MDPGGTTGVDSAPVTPAHEQVRRLGTVLGVWAHPDDEAYLSAGLMALAVDVGARVVCVTATKGERGTPDPERFPPDHLAEVRTREMEAALAALGVTEHRWLDHADGGCADIPHEIGVGQIMSIIEELEPNTVVTFGPEGMTGHPDHITVGAWTSEAVRRVGGARLLHATMDRGLMEGLPEFLPVYGPDGPPLVEREHAAVLLDLPPDVLDRKQAALRAQESQTSSLIDLFGHDRYRRWLSIEAFVEGHPG